MELSQLKFLISSDGQRLLRETAQNPINDDNHLQIASQLRQRLNPETAQSVVEIVMLRQLGLKKYSRAAEMFFTRPALEQASAEPVAIYRAQRFADAGFSLVADLGCSIGGDALALTAHADVVGIDCDLLRLVMARENA
ncbi:MAG: hypothetical protein R3293_23365, partial [Candidatus Promineifilaceae bacterium]|nr:hypothetical protein [Candidatus Promineifilaceae bacterium]